MTFWGVLVTNLYLLPEHFAARREVPWNDGQLARIDRTLGVEVPDVLRLMEQWPGVAHLLEFAYGLLILLVMLTIMIPPLYGRMDKAKEFAIASLAAAAVSIPLLAFFQAAGPWSIYGYAPSPEQAGMTRTLLALRSGEAFELDLGNHDGLICFPSFHTVLAVLCCVALWPVPFVRWPSAIVAGLIVLSTVTTGWHYIVDVLGGLIVAAAALAAARGYLRLEQVESWAWWRQARREPATGLLSLGAEGPAAGDVRSAVARGDVAIPQSRELNSPGKWPDAGPVRLNDRGAR
jgi:membrane-associated phospholipid phosphatase